MPEAVFYSEEVHPTVAQYITEHGGKVQIERVDPGWVFHKITIEYTQYNRFGGGDSSPIYKYVLADGGLLLIQTHRSKGLVPGHAEAYWETLYIEREDR